MSTCPQVELDSERVCRSAEGLAGGHLISGWFESTITRISIDFGLNAQSPSRVLNADSAVGRGSRFQRFLRVVLSSVTGCKSGRQG